MHKTVDVQSTALSLAEYNASHARRISVPLLCRRTGTGQPFLRAIRVLRRDSLERPYNGRPSPAVLGDLLVYEARRLRQFEVCRLLSSPPRILPTQRLYELAGLHYCTRHVLLSQRASYVLSFIAVSHNQVQPIHPVNLPLLHLELDPALLNTTYGHLLKSDTTIVMRAMGVSLDKGMPVTIKLAHFSCPQEIMFFATDAKGKRHLLHTSKLRLPKVC